MVRAAAILATILAAGALAASCSGAEQGGANKGGAATGPVIKPDLGSLEASGAVPAAADDTCRARALAGAMGRPFDMPGMPEAGGDIRYLQPGDMATTDFQPERLNLELDETGRVVKLRCG